MAGGRSVEEMVMRRTEGGRAECTARALALLVVADACVDKREMQCLDKLDAFRRIGVSRARFQEIAEACREDVGESLAGQSWLRLEDLERMAPILNAVDDRADRLLVCRLAASVLTADGCVTGAEHLVYDYVLSYWHINHSMVTEAILHDHAH